MANTVVKTFDLYNSTFYWNGYTLSNALSTQLSVTQAYYATQYSSNVIGSQIDFFTELAGVTANNIAFNLSGITIGNLPYLWSKYWWDEAMYYSNSYVLSAITTSFPTYYQSFSESVGCLYYIQDPVTVPYSSLISSLIPPTVSNNIQSFYATVNNLFATNIAAIGPKGTDTAPNNSSLIAPTSDQLRRFNSSASLANTINGTYPILSMFLPFNNNVVGNLITPYNWYSFMPYDDSSLEFGLLVDQTNSIISSQITLPVSALQVT